MRYVVSVFVHNISHMHNSAIPHAASRRFPGARNRQPRPPARLATTRACHSLSIPPSAPSRRTFTTSGQVRSGGDSDERGDDEVAEQHCYRRRFCGLMIYLLGRREMEDGGLVGITSVWRWMAVKRVWGFERVAAVWWTEEDEVEGGVCERCATRYMYP